MDAQIVPTKEEALGISVKCAVDNTREIVFQTFLPRSASPQEIDELLNRVLGSAERVGAANQLKVWKHKLADDEGKLKLATQAFQDLEKRHQDAWGSSGRQGKFKLTPQQESERNASLSMQERYKQEIEIAKLNIAQYEKTLADAKAE